MIVMNGPLFSLLRDPEFLRGYALLVAQTALVSIIGGLLGVGAGAFVYRSDWLAQSLRDLLRLGMWLPFFFLGGLMYWGDRTVWHLNIHTRPLLAVVVAATPATILASCYYYLCLRSLTDLDRVHARLQLFKVIVFQAMLFCLVCQFSSAFARPNLWPWAWFATGPDFLAVASAFGLLMGLIVLTINAISSSTLDRTASLRGRIIENEIARSRASVSGIILIVSICLSVWQVYHRRFKEVFLFSSPKEVLKAGYQMLVTGIQEMGPPFNGETEWQDIGISLLEIVVGISLAAALGFIVLTALEKAPSVTKTKWSHLLCVTYITPIALWQAAFPLVGIGILHKIVLIGCLTFFPILEIFWILRESSIFVRSIVAIDEALPLAFVGMIVGELYAATAGIGFFIVVSSATSRSGESTAMSLLGFGLLVVLSCALRFAVSRIGSKSKLAACEMS